MHNLKEEILQIALDKLQNKVKAIMLDINMLLSSPEKVDNIVERISLLIAELSMANAAYEQGLALLQQVQKQATDAFNEIMSHANKSSDRESLKKQKE